MSLLPIIKAPDPVLKKISVSSACPRLLAIIIALLIQNNIIFLYEIKLVAVLEVIFVIIFLGWLLIKNSLNQLIFAFG